MQSETPYVNLENAIIEKPYAKLVNAKEKHIRKLKRENQYANLENSMQKDIRQFRKCKAKSHTKT